MILHLHTAVLCWLFSMSAYGVALVFCQRQHGACSVVSVPGMFLTSTKKAIWAPLLWSSQQTLLSQTTSQVPSTTCWSFPAFLAAVYFSQHKALLVFPVSCLYTGLKFYLLKNCIITALCNRPDLQHTKPVPCFSSACCILDINRLLFYIHN